jgi:hypothetical protein
MTNVFFTGEGRTALGNNCNFTFARWVDILTALGELAACSALMAAAGVVMGAPKHKRKTLRGLVDLGTLSYNATHDITCAKYIPPVAYDDFIQNLIGAREKGLEWAREKYMATFGALCEQQFEESGCLFERELVPSKHLTSGCELQDVRCRINEDTPQECDVAQLLRIREGLELPPNMALASGDCVWATQLPSKPIDPTSLAVPAKVAKKLEELESKLLQSSQFLYENDGEMESTFDLEGDGTPDTLLGEHQRLVAKAKSDRDKLDAEDDIREQNQIGARLELCQGDTRGLSVLEWKGLVNGTFVLEEDGSVTYSDQLLARIQQRDRVDRERCRRFIVGRLLNFAIELKQGHDVTLGSCFIIEWGGKKTFAVVRVLKMYGDDNERVYSMKMNRKSRKQHYRVELLVPVTDDTSGTSLYQSSGWQLGPVAGTKVLRLIDMVPLCSIVDVGSLMEPHRHQACLPVSTILDLKRKGYNQVRVTSYDSLVNEVEGFDAEAIPVEGYHPKTRCYSCKSCWFDHTQGVIVACTKCHRSYHQECHFPTIKSSAIDTWVCGVCDGVDTQVCVACNEPCTEQECEDPSSLENNELVLCTQCNSWWHQHCHAPSVYPLPIADFVCSNCDDFVPQGPTHSRGTLHLRSQRKRKSKAPKEAPEAPRAPRMERSRRELTVYSGHGLDPLGLVGCTIEVSWADNKAYAGVVKAYNDDADTYKVAYIDDGEVHDEDLDPEEGNFKVLKRPSFKESAHKRSTRNERLAHGALPES